MALTERGWRAILVGAAVGLPTAGGAHLSLPDSQAVVGVLCGMTLAGVAAVALAAEDCQSQLVTAAVTALALGGVTALGTAGYFLVAGSGPVPRVVGLLLGVQAGAVAFFATAGGGVVATAGRAVRVEMVTGTLRSPAFFGSVAGFLSGTLGFVVLPGTYGFLGAMSGAVWGGVTAALLTDGPVESAVGHAALADLLSSVYVFAGFWVYITAGQGDPSALLLFPYYVGFGALVAIPVGALSLIIASVSGGFTAAVRDPNRQQLW